MKFVIELSPKEIARLEALVDTDLVENMNTEKCKKCVYRNENMCKRHKTKIGIAIIRCMVESKFCAAAKHNYEIKHGVEVITPRRDENGIILVEKEEDWKW